MDKELRELERKVLGGDASLLPALRRAYQRAGPIDDETEKPKLPAKSHPLLIPQPIAHQPRRRPLWDKVLIPPTQAGDGVSSWAFEWGAGALDPISGDLKTAADTSASLHGRILPTQDSCFFWQAVSIVPDSGSVASDVETVWNDLVLELWPNGPAGVASHRWPIRNVMRPPTVMPQDESGVLHLAGTVHSPLDIRVPGRRRVMRPQGPITIASRFPFEITGQCNTRLRISGAPRRRIEGVVRLMLILHGILLTPTA